MANAAEFFAERYRNKSTRELAQLATDEENLVPEARQALRTEIARRDTPITQAPALDQSVDSAQTQNDLDGVKGWLFLYCLGLIVACIHSTIGLVTATINGGIPLAIALLVLAIIGWDIATAIALFRRARFALTMVLLQLVVAAVAIAIRLGAATALFIASKQSEGVGVRFLTNLLICGETFVWYRYFCVSKRVRLTFGRNL